VPHKEVTHLDHPSSVVTEEGRGFSGGNLVNVGGAQIKKCEGRGFKGQIEREKVRLFQLRREISRGKMG